MSERKDPTPKSRPAGGSNRPQMVERESTQKGGGRTAGGERAPAFNEVRKDWALVDDIADDAKEVAADDGISLDEKRSQKPSNLIVQLPGQTRRRRGGRRGGGGMSLPPQMNLSTTFRFRMMYQTSSATPSDVTVAHMLAWPGCICTVANTTMVPIASSMRLRKITLWPSAATSTPDECYVNWLTGASGRTRDQQRIRILPDGVTETGAVVFRPPRTSIAGDWLTNNVSGTVFTISGAVGSICLVEVMATLTNAQSVSTVTITTGSIGAYYYPYLDGPTNHRWRPLALNYTF